MNAVERINDGVSTSAAGAVKIMQVDDEIASTSTTVCIGIDCVRSSIMKTHWAAASARFTTTFVNNPFGHNCDVCDGLWFLRSLKLTKDKHLPLLNNNFPGEPVAYSRTTHGRAHEQPQMSLILPEAIVVSWLIFEMTFNFKALKRKTYI
uniref:Uncharacterized protein n=1 Tax=Rhodnius prolixus TaxID=13249 RepID=T1IDC9_RHOPR